MQGLKKITFKILIIFVISAILVNILIPPLVCAVEDFREEADNMKKDIQQQYKQKEDLINQISSEELRNQVRENEDAFITFMDLVKYEGKDTKDMNAVATEFLDKYIDFMKDSEVGEYKTVLNGRKYDDNGENTTDYDTYLKRLAAEYYEGKSLAQQEEEAKTPEQKEEEQKQKEREEEEKYIQSLLAKDDEGFSKGDGIWDRAKRSIEKQCFEAIALIVTTIGDGVINVLQNIAIEGSPTAVSTRVNSDYIKEKLEARDKDAYIISYAGEATYRETDHESQKIEKVMTPADNAKSVVEVPFIYYSPSAILSNKIPLFDINFINTDRQLINPFLADENGKYSDDMLDKAKERLEATEKNDIWKDRIDELKTNLEENIAKDAQGENKANPAATLQNVIAKWYVAIRNLSITALLIVLVYIGIRIVISATAEETAKYKTLLKDWALGLVIVMCMHLIMLLLITLTQIITEMINNQSIDFVNDPFRRRYVYEYYKNQHSLLYEKRSMVLTTRIFFNIYSCFMVFNNFYMEISKKDSIHGFLNSNSTISRTNIFNRQNRRKNVSIIQFMVKRIYIQLNNTTNRFIIIHNNNNYSTRYSRLEFYIFNSSNRIHITIRKIYKENVSD